jgi:MarR family transcriptional regulator, organic hydroperoxide resistance regulator
MRGNLSRYLRLSTFGAVDYSRGVAMRPSDLQPRRSAGARGAARDAWRLLTELGYLQRARVASVAAHVGLSPVQCHVLRLLDPDEPLPMSRVADALACDASNVTGIVDRLEGRGLVMRRTALHDRRLKFLALTPRGMALRTEIMERLLEPPPALAGLDAEDLQSLCAILARALR